MKDSCPLRLVCFLCSAFFLNQFATAQDSQLTIDWKSEESVDLSSRFEDYQIATIPSDLMRYFNRNDEELDRVSIEWKLAGEFNMIELTRNNLYAHDFRSLDHTNGGFEEVSHKLPLTYEGTINGKGKVRMTFSDHFMVGAIWLNDQLYYIEKANRFSDRFNADDMIMYEASDVIVESPFLCGVEDKKKSSRHAVEHPDRFILNTTTGSTTCRKIEVAQAYDVGITTRYGNPGVSTWNAAIWNVVNGFYIGQFSVDVEFLIKVEAFNAGVTTSTNITTFLNNFSVWGNGGGFGTTDFDIGNLWTTINVEGGGNFGVIGSVMAIPGVCGNSRYQIFEDFVGPTPNPPTGNNLARLAVLIAHECGHNIGMFHNNPAGANIMEPFVNLNANSFSSRSRHYFESTAMNVPCYSSCSCIEVVQVTPTNCSADGSTFDVSVEVEHDNSVGGFTAVMGGVSQSFGYGANPQTINLNAVPSGTSSITVTDNVDGTCTFTVDIVLPNQATISGISSDPYCEDNLPGAQALSSDVSESFGSIIIDLNGDNFANTEQSAQVIDAAGNVVVNYPRGTFAQNGNTTLNSGPLLISAGPYAVQLADSFGDGMGSVACQATNGGPGDYEIRDGQGNVIRAAAPLSNVTGSNGQPCSGNNAAMEETTGIAPAVDLTTSGNYSGAGITDAVMDDGAASFDASGLTPGAQTINYTYNTVNGCSATQVIVDIFDVPVLTLDNATCTNGTEYSAVIQVDLGIWNSVASGDAANISVSSGGVGSLSSSSIAANGNITVSNIPDGQSFTLTVGDGTENGGCQAALLVDAPDPSCAALPVEWISFSGLHTDGINRLSWTTASENNNRGFSILSSEDGIRFEKIGWVDGHNNSSEINTYIFKDKNYFNKTYYQIEQVDFDGKNQKTVIISILSPRIKYSLNVLQNPFTNQIIAQVPEYIDHLRISNTLGQTLYFDEVHGEELQLDSSTWPFGIYYMVGYDEGKQAEVLKIVKN